MSNEYEDSSSGTLPEPKPGPFLAKVISHQDPTYMGILEVELLRPVGNTGSEGQLHQVKMMTPFGGATSVDYIGDEDDYNNTQKSYGMWFVPPDVGTTVMVIFIDGDPKRGFWIGCVVDNAMNFMTPGIAATEQVVEGGPRAPVAEYNKKVNSSVSDPTMIKKPKHPLAQVLEDQGLLEDDIRGITTSSARRETPSMVFGISTPGPLDTRPGAKTGKIGKKEWVIDNAFVSRLGGSTFVMDDGDDKYLRKTPASEGPPEYAAVEQGETDGDRTIPHNELIRLRTRTGHQILLHNSEDLIYIGNARGTSWIELSSDGKIDIYAEDSISMHTKQDFNFYADRDINMEVGRNFNLKVADRHQTEVGGDCNLLVTGNNNIGITGNLSLVVTGNNTVTTNGELNLKTEGGNKFTAGGATDILSGGKHTETATEIHMNGPAAVSASIATAPEPLSTFANPDETETTIDSIMLRIPSHEPWPHHENLDPASFKPDQTDREAGNDIVVPTGWKVYSTTTDTFAKIKAADEEPQ